MSPKSAAARLYPMTAATRATTSDASARRISIFPPRGPGGPIRMWPAKARGREGRPNLRESLRALDFQSRFAPADRATRTALRVPCLYAKRRHLVTVRRVAPSSDGSAAPSDKADALVPAPAGIKIGRAHV